MDCRERAVVIDDIELLATALGILRRKGEQVEVEGAQVLVLAAQVVQFIDCGRGKVDKWSSSSTAVGAKSTAKTSCPRKAHASAS